MLPGEVRYANVMGGDLKPKWRYVLVLSRPIAGSKNVFLLAFSSKIQNARPDDVVISDPAELLQAGLTVPSYVSTNFVFTMPAGELSILKGTLTPATFKFVSSTFISHIG